MNTGKQFILVDESEYAQREHGGNLYWCKDAWSTDVSRATVYSTIEAAEAQKQRWIERSEHTWANLFKPSPAPVGSKAPKCIGHTATVHDKTAILARSRIAYAAFRGAYDAALAAEFDVPAARAIGNAARAAAVTAAFPHGTRVEAPWSVEDGDDPEYDHRGRPVAAGYHSAAERRMSC